MLERFAGPVFETKDIPFLLLLLVFAALPYILSVVTLILFMRDAIRKKLHKSSIILAICTILTWLIALFLRNRI